MEILGYLLFQHLVTLITNKKVSFYEEVVYEEVVAATHLAECQKSENSCPLTLTKAQLLTSAPRPVTAEAGNQQKAAQFCPL